MRFIEDMLRDRNTQDSLSHFLRYLAAHEQDENATLPALASLSQELGMSVAGLREQLEVARALGLVEVKPRTGIRRLPYTFLPALRQSLGYAMALDEKNFQLYADLRKHVEAAYWHEAVAALTPEDHHTLNNLLARAWAKLNGTPVQIPHEEHKLLHLTIFSRLQNPFVAGILEAYWEAYEAIGLNVYNGYDYLREVWQYHQQMVESICNGDPETGYKAMLEHTDMLSDLLVHRP
jgi:DNA-binding FadR family transcriptional regulator